MRTERAFVLLILAAATLFIGYFVANSEGFHGGGDSLAHYRLAKFSWEHPKYLLDHWGKPVFTLLAMPFAQIGFKAVQFFNLLCGIICVLLAVGIAREMKWRFKWMLVPLIMFTPIFMEEFYSGLTEACLAMLLLFGIWLKLKKKNIAFLLVLSILPFVRTEGALFTIWLGLLFLIQQKWWNVLLIFTGTAIYSLLGWIFKGDLFWLINEMPYSGGENIYGSGSFWHYFQIMPKYIGWLVLVPVIVGLGLLPFTFFHGRHKETKWILVNLVVPIILFVCFHSFMWWMGRVSLGLPRILAVVVPLMALLAVFGMNEVKRYTSILVGTSYAVMIAATSSWVMFTSFQLLVPLGEEEKILQKVADYIYANELDEHKIHYYSLYNEITLGLNPHYPEQCQQVVHNRADPHEEVAPGSLVIWDAHYSPNEGAMPLENLTENKHFEVLKIFRPEQPFNTLGDRPYEVYLFLRKED